MNFKKIFAATVITLLMLSTSSAQTTVPIYWPFSLASTHANMVRTIASELNKAQKDYTFIFAHKPGAGGSIAANTLINHRGPAIMAATSSFFIRPNLYPTTSYDLSKFNTLGSYCDNQPLALISTKYKSVSEFKNNPVSIGVIPGSITQLTAMAYEKESRSNLTTVFYQGTPEMTKDVLGRHLDVSVDFLSSAIQFAGKVNVLGITGNKDYPAGQTFKSQGIKNIDITHANFLIYANDADPKLIETTRLILADVLKSHKLQETCQQEYGMSVTKVPSVKEANKLYTEQVNFWRKQSTGIVIEK